MSKTPSFAAPLTHSHEETKVLSQVKTSVGITYTVLSDTLVKAVQQAQQDGRMEVSTQKDILDALYFAPRLVHWHPVDGGFRLFAINDSVFVTVTAERIYITKGIRVYDIVSGLTAATLHDSISKAQKIVAAVNPPSMTDEEQAEFFAPDPNASHVDIDSALADPIDDESGRDATLMEEALEIEEPVLEDTSEKQYVGKTTTAATQEAAQIKQEFSGGELGYCQNHNIYHTSKGSCPKCPKKSKAAQLEVGVAAAIGRGSVSRLKSLQGRVLNIVEASFSDKQQREAVKTLINKEFRREMNLIQGAESDEE